MVDTAAALIRLVLRVLVLKIGAWTVSARIRPELIKLVLRNPVRIGSKELLMMPPFAILIPPFTLMVDAFRVEGMPGMVWGNTTPFMDDTERLAELMVLVLRAFAVIVAVLMVLVLRAFAVIVAVLIVLVLRAGVLMPPLRVARPLTNKVFPSCVGSCISTFPEPTDRPPLTTDMPPDTIREPFVIVCPPFTVSVDAFRVDGIPPPPGGGYVAPFTELTLILAVLILMVLRAGDLIFSEAAKTEAPTIAPN
jgi:hypothetical protein